MWYVNGLLCQTAQARDIAVAHYLRTGEEPEVEPVDRTPDGGYILPINNPEET